MVVVYKFTDVTITRTLSCSIPVVPILPLHCYHHSRSQPLEADSEEKTVVALLANSGNGGRIDVLVRFQVLEQLAYAFDVGVIVIGIGDASLAHDVVHDLSSQRRTIRTSEETVMQSYGLRTITPPFRTRRLASST